MSKRCFRVEHFGLLDVDLYWLDIILKQAGCTALGTPTFTPARATGNRDLPMMVWPIVQASCHLTSLVNARFYLLANLGANLPFSICRTYTDPREKAAGLLRI